MDKKSEGGTARMAHPIWPKRYFIPCNIMLDNKTGIEKKGWGVGDAASKLDIAQRLAEHCSVYGKWRVIAFASPGFFPLFTLLNCLYLDPSFAIPIFSAVLIGKWGKEKRMALGVLSCWLVSAPNIGEHCLHILTKVIETTFLLCSHVWNTNIPSFCYHLPTLSFGSGWSLKKGLVLRIFVQFCKVIIKYIHVVHLGVFLKKWSMMKPQMKQKFHQKTLFPVHTFLQPLLLHSPRQNLREFLNLISTGSSHILALHPSH